MPPLYPLTFQPIFKRYLWGGRRLGTVLGKPIGPEADYAESWEIVDRHDDQSVIANGPLAGVTLHELVKTRGDELLARHFPQPRFPLLFKFLDCSRDLSVQVHPDDAAAARLVPPDFGKTEAWLVLQAAPGSRIYAGLRPGCGREVLEQAAKAAHVESCLHFFDAAAGQCVFIPAGTVHALGAGLLVAEIQQASDTTYRLYDWNRLDAGGRPRTLHLEQALEVIDYAAGAVLPLTPAPTDQLHIQRLVACDKFIMDRWELDSRRTLGGDGRFHIVSVLEGQIAIDHALLPTLVLGQTALLPACLPPLWLTPQKRAMLLDIYLPR